jgi:hypothetical protein
MDNWVFADPPNVAVLTTRSVVEDGRWIAKVSHDEEDGAWQFHDDDDVPKSEEEARLVSLRSMVARDASLNRLADLPLGWRAWRDEPGGEWQRARA